MLESLTDNQRNLLIRLPYRAGLYVSQADQSGGDEADAREVKVLSDLLHGFARDVMGAEISQNVISATIADPDLWTGWGADLDSVPAECAAAVDVLSGMVDAKDVRAFAVEIYEIGEAVALAFTEEQPQGLFARAMLYLTYTKDQMRARKYGAREKSFEEFQSISAAERSALAKLSESLGLYA